MRQIKERLEGTIELRFAATAIDVNMELRDFPLGTYEVVPTGVREEKVIMYPVNAPGADEQYELSYETFMQRINSVGEFIPNELPSNAQAVQGEVTMRRSNEKKQEARMASNVARDVEEFGERMMDEGWEVDIDYGLPYIGVNGPSGEDVYFSQGEDAAELLDDVPENVNEKHFILWYLDSAGALEESATILTIPKEVEIPEAGVILEKGDRIRVVEVDMDDEDYEDEPPTEMDFQDEAVLADTSRGLHLTIEGKSHGTFEDEDEALLYIENWARKNNYYPSIYYVNDHGNVDLLDYEGNIIQSWV